MNILSLVFLFASITSFASSERTIGSWCREKWGKDGNELMIGSAGVKRLQEGWVVPLQKTDSSDTCKKYSNQINGVLKNYSYNQICLASYKCTDKNKNTESLTFYIDNKEVTLLNIIGKTKHIASSSCTSMLYQIEQKLVERCDL